MNIKAIISSVRARVTDTSGGAFELVLAKLYLRLQPSARYRIYQMLARLMDAKIDTKSCLEFIYDVLSNEGRNPREMDALAVSYWIKAYREHGMLSMAIAGWVPMSEVLLIEAGERSGRFQATLTTMIELNKKLSSVRMQMASSLLYPLGLVALLSYVIYFMAENFVPQIVAIRGEGAQWTGVGGQSLAFLQWAGDWLFLSLGGIAAVVAAIIFTMPYFRGPLRAVFDRIPPWSFHRFITATGFMTALVVFMQSGRGLVEALGLILPNASPYLSQKVQRVERLMREGEDFGSALAMSGDEFPDRELIKELQIFARIGRLDEGLLAVSTQWMDGATVRAAAQIKIFSWVLMGLVFGVLGFVMSGLYDIIGQLNRGM